MLIYFTPYTFLYITIYITFLFSFFMSTSFIWCWIVIEVLILLFMGISYTLFYNSFSSLLVYFLVQAFSSFSILIFYLCSLNILFTLMFILNLSIFPFQSWFISSTYSFPNFMLFIASTFHNVPILIILLFYPLPLFYPILWSSIFLTFMVSGFLILTTNDFRLLLISSSVGNNSWLILSCFSGLSTFIVFITTYFITLFLFMYILGASSKPFSFDYHGHSHYTLPLLLVFSSLSGLPPFPLFFTNMYAIYNLFFTAGLSSSVLFLTLVSSSFLLMGYLSMLLNILVYSYSSVASFTFYANNF